MSSSVHAEAMLVGSVPPALRMCRELVDIPTREEFLRAGSAALARAFDADLAFFNECGIRDGGWAVVEAECAQQDRETVTAAVAVMGADHPGVASYLMDPRDMTPRRASDAIARVRDRTRRPLAPHRIMGVDHQLSMLVALSPDVGRGWVVMRSTRDFTNDQVATASNVLSLLTALDRLHPAARPESVRPPCAPLTAREAEVLREVASGATAAAIGRRLGISAATVRKHLERVYAKLDCHDRLIAVERARTLGLVPA